MHKNNNSILSLPRNAILLFGLACFGVFQNSLMQILPLSLKSQIFLSIIFVLFSYYCIFKVLWKTYRTINFIFIFVLLSFPFAYGQHLVSLFDSDYLFRFQTFHILDGRLQDSSIINATYFIIVFLILLTVGYILSNTYYKEQVIVNESGLMAGNSIVIFISLLFLLISIYPAFKEVIAQYNLSRQFSYLVRRQLESQENYYELLGVGTRELYLGKWFLPSIYMLLLSFQDLRKRVLPYSILLVYSIIYMLTGSRFTLLKIILVVFLIEYIWHKSITLRQIKYLPIVFIPLIVAFSIITSLRGDSGVTFEDFLTNATFYINGSPLSATLWETGITFTSVSNVIDKVPSVVPFFIGKSYLGAILVCLPAFLRFGFTDNNIFTISSTFSPLYYGTRGFGYGSSIYAEQFYNFGYFALIVAIFLGIIIGKLEKKMFLYQKQRNLSQFLLIVFILGELIYSVRNDLYAIPRTVLISVGIPLMVIWLVKSLLSLSNK
ncbi:TPA: O-antigen polysaccharide polymerase Wzy [Streptococcus suis]|nr:O-antigen polysaccharide polymerase Wzy [Streptococcus suis]AGS58329.1 oligosaccharide repeat unit polymerase Wzy [Streptococcus suis]MCK3984945.1 O-antigen polysaccharide polymerase Wzy [Streptococcus suis]NQG42959.1 O-antigen polysaccharide polymerase Wzy [Streptococcus suis]NQH11765.1 O-antigen polysaccharide polymerase Wzy [Streptococcus suis]NQH23056.1 O-antigen polysaccharide polymerase Wzy [Streptococcus suis]